MALLTDKRLKWFVYFSSFCWLYKVILWIKCFEFVSLLSDRTGPACLRVPRLQPGPQLLHPGPCHMLAPKSAPRCTSSHCRTPVLHRQQDSPRPPCPPPLPPHPRPPTPTQLLPAPAAPHTLPSQSSTHTQQGEDHSWAHTVTKLFFFFLQCVKVIAVRVSLRENWFISLSLGISFKVPGTILSLVVF